MTREEACKILNVEEVAELDPAEIMKVNHTPFLYIMQRFEILIAKNDLSKGGSFYIQSKIYFAKEQLMQDFSADLNTSKYNPGSD
jgi:import inner membrane translocase subunit TIM16